MLASVVHPKIIRETAEDGTMLIHASAVSIGGQGVLFVGPSGSGKSDLALRLIDRGAVLIADDVVAIRCDGDVLVAHAPEAIRGKLEVRGLGIIVFPSANDVPIALIANLDEGFGKTDFLGVPLPTISLKASRDSTPLAVEHFVAILQSGAHGSGGQLFGTSLNFPE
jgi:ABC-type phosphate transport system ATPase subunit